MKATTATVGISRLAPVFGTLESTTLANPQTPEKVALVEALLHEITQVCGQAYGELEESLEVLSQLTPDSSL